jgi:short-subunit dehydrogenase
MASTALITGASGGIGLELARIFAARGHRLVLVARGENRLKELASELHTETVVVPADLSRMDEVEKLYRQLEQQNIQVDYLVNNAGFGDFGFFYETRWEKEAMMIDLNVKSLTYMTKLFLPAMVARGSGRIMNLASTAAFQPGPLMAVYYATKAYVLHFSEAIANEVREKGITVTALCPGPTESGFQKAAAVEESKMVKGKKLPSSAAVARYGYDAMMRGKIVAVHGTMNKLMTEFIRVAPRSLVPKIVRRLQKKAE